ncbi:Metalloenzyme, LuxS/M16 peptidase-like protein [Jimgerdemannia flammicorona]|uniref:Metalloenzyme, LuxS/M16 peptidase-like protein n=1 Tax=Jimgerdemannia flammicorona TaxID=994334 RepID=A0A433PPH1_9FUNG|nr:Metalloenzyme, LuxS/M16 peptidase-like protein [Jimgerdemannia flammicorona]
MTTHFLHREIREKNGAYGGGVRYVGLNGLFSFYSYRDPRTLETLQTYGNAVDWVQQRKFTEQELVEAKLSIFQSVDAPLSVAEEGLTTFADGINDDMRQRRREQLLKVTEEDIKEAAIKYLQQQETESKYSVAILGELNDKVSEETGWKVQKWGVADKAAAEIPATPVTEQAVTSA